MTHDLHYDVNCLISQTRTYSQAMKITPLLALCTASVLHVSHAQEIAFYFVHDAASRGDKDALLSLIEQEQDIDTVDDDGNTPLGLACLAGHEEIAEILIKEGANIHHKNERGNNILMAAFHGKSEKLARRLLDLGADYRDSDVITGAAMSGMSSLLEFFIKEGVPLPLEDGVSVALALAAQEGHTDCVKILLEAGASAMNQENTEFRNMSLGLACLKGHADVVKLLLEAGADPNIPAGFEGKLPFSPLFLASQEGFLDCVKLLMEHGAQPDLDANGLTALFMACHKSHAEVAFHLLAHGASAKKAPLAIIACVEMDQDEPRLLQALLASGADVNTVNRANNSALHKAAFHGHRAILRLLLEKGAKQHRNKDGQTPLEIAQERKHEGCVLLLQQGPDAKLPPKKTPPALRPQDQALLDLVKKGGSLADLQALLAQGADVNALDDKSVSVLMHACENCDDALVQELLKKGADIFHINKWGSSALTYSISSKKPALVQQFLNAGLKIRQSRHHEVACLEAACTAGNVELLRELFAQGIAYPRHSDDSLLVYSLNHPAELMQVLIENGADLNIPLFGDMPTFGATSLLAFLSMVGKAEHVAAILQAGERDQGDTIETSPLALALMKKHSDIARMLILADFDKNWRIKDASPLAIACAAQDKANILLLLERGAKPEMPEWKPGDPTLLMNFCTLGDLDIVKALIKAGADLNAKDAEGKTARDLATPQVAEYLDSLKK